MSRPIAESNVNKARESTAKEMSRAIKEKSQSDYAELECAHIPVTVCKCECKLEYHFTQPNRSSGCRDGSICHLGIETIERLAKLN